MSRHELIRSKVALAASRVLSPEEAREVEQHARECVACRRELEVWGFYSRGLGGLPQPALPLGLVARTQARILRERADATERRRHAVLLGGLAVFSWLVNLAFWSVARALTGGVLEVLGMNLVSAFSWFLVSSMLALITAAVSAGMLGGRGVRRFS
jgi:hypothetical protein